MTKRAKVIVGVVGTVYAIGLVSIFAAALIDQHRLVYPTPERQSTFLRTYNPQTTIKEFLGSRPVPTSGGADGSEGGNGAATYNKMFEAQFPLRPDDRQALTNALAQQIVADLRDSGGSIVEQRGNDADGFTFKYVEGKSTGTVTLKPLRKLDEDELASLNPVGSKSLPWWVNPGEVPVEFTVSVKETWTR